MRTVHMNCVELCFECIDLKFKIKICMYIQPHNQKMSSLLKQAYCYVIGCDKEAVKHEQTEPSPTEIGIFGFCKSNQHMIDPNGSNCKYPCENTTAEALPLTADGQVDRTKYWECEHPQERGYSVNTATGCITKIPNCPRPFIPR